jgi:hypothetical protein
MLVGRRQESVIRLKYHNALESSARMIWRRHSFGLSHSIWHLGRA